MSKFARVGPVPPDFDLISPTLNALDDEVKRRAGEAYQGRSRAENNWLIPQIDWQRTRYIHDMYHKFHRISKECFDYCVRNKIINGKLSEKWLEKGYERLCSLHAIDPRNFQFGGTSICRVPRWKLRSDQQDVASVFNGCRGCASGKGAGSENIFGNKYGQRLAAIQIRREELADELEVKRTIEAEEEKIRIEAEAMKVMEKKEKKHKKRIKDAESDEQPKSDGACPALESSEATKADELREDESKNKKEKKEKKQKKKQKDTFDGPVWAQNATEEVMGLQDAEDEAEEQDSASKRQKIGSQ